MKTISCSSIKVLYK
uniref:Uncharacterized protein n=1 Tax=Anguilla anguilla TaxID=7936 RepID=A0A0E9Q8W2_ANGAN